MLCWTAPALSRGCLYLRNPSRLVCVYVGQPDELDPELRAQATTAAALPQTERTDWSWVLGREPEYHFDAPSLEELLLWYQVCAGVILGSALALASVIHGLCRWRGWRAAPRAGWVVFGLASFLLGLAGTTVASRYLDQFVLTWPVCLFVAYDTVLFTITWAERQPNLKRSRWVSRLVVVLFLVLGFVYYELCRTVGLATGLWFLIGLLPAFPLGVLAARFQYHGRHWLLQMLSVLAAFTVYFWSSGLLLVWRMHVNG